MLHLLCTGTELKPLTACRAYVGVFRPVRACSRLTSGANVRPRTTGCQAQYLRVSDPWLYILPVAEKNQAAVDLGKKRWAKATKAQRLAHAMKMVKARLEKREREAAEAEARAS